MDRRQQTYKTPIKIQKFTPEDKQEEDSEIQSQIRKMVHKPPDTEDDEEFILQEVMNVIQCMGIKRPQEKTEFQTRCGNA